MSNTFDVGVIGMGVAGAFACLKLSETNKNLKVISFDLGRPPQKRRRQIDGFLGCLPNSDGKLYLNDLDKVTELVGIRKTKSAYNCFNKTLSNIGDFNLVKDRSPSISFNKRLANNGYSAKLNNHYQVYPKDIHVLSKYMSNIFDNNKNLTMSFDNEVKSICKQNSMFVISSEDGEFRCKKLIFAVGRSGWRWATEIYNKFGIVDSNDIAKFGIRIEMNSSLLKSLNKSACTISKGKDLEIGPFNWYGSVIPEDHVDMAISAFRSNENRWKTDKVSFTVIGNMPYPNKGFEQTDRLGKLTFVLANDRIIKEKVSAIISGKSKISIIPEYDWLKQTLTDFSTIIPEILNKAYFHVPTITPFTPQINIGNNLETGVDGLFVAGESAGLGGILSAATTGIICADMVNK